MFQLFSLHVITFFSILPTNARLMFLEHFSHFINLKHHYYLLNQDQASKLHIYSPPLPSSGVSKI